MNLSSRVHRALFGAPKDVKDPEAFHKLSLVALLAWVGLGADGLSSSAYGPDEAFRALGEHTGLAIFLAVATALTVFIISYGYSRIIEQFPSGGGGYLVASRLLGPRVGVVSGAALLVDYVLTITISIASGADQIFSFLPPWMLAYKLPFAFACLILLTVMNLRGVKESVTSITPIFGLFLLTHAIVLCVAIGGHISDAPQVAGEVQRSVSHTVGTLGLAATLQLFVRAYSLGGGTYTGIEAVSNGMAIMREPRVRTAKRTMILMATSLAVTAGGILLAYLLVHAAPEEGKTMNYVLLDRVAGSWQLGGWNIGRAFVIVSLVSEGALLFVAAQAGFLDGPRVMANMATDSWLPHRFSALSERLTMRNGVMLMSAASVLALVYTKGDVSKLAVMYSINVFLTFSLSNIAMTLFWFRNRDVDAGWWRHLPAHVLASLLCVTILGITIYEKFTEGGWLTVVITMALTFFCFFVKKHYALVGRALGRFDRELPGPDEAPEIYEGYQGSVPAEKLPLPEQSDLPIALVFVGGYSGLGRHALVTLLRMFPGHFRGIVFGSIAVVDSDTFKGASEVEALEQKTQKNLEQYERLAASVGMPSTSAYGIGIEVAVEAENLANRIIARYPRGLVVAGQIIFDEDTAWNRLLHNETAFLIQRRLQHAGVPMIVLPVQLDLAAAQSDQPVGRMGKDRARATSGAA
jgi:amino acid transporter